MIHDPYSVNPRKPLTNKQRYVRGPLEVRLWAKIDTRRTDDECWPFIGAKTRRGYGKLGHEGRTLLAHRLMFAWAKHPIDKDVVVMHACDNPSCCNPAHLSVGSLSDNTQDMIAKGRHFTPWRGESAKHSKLSEDDVRAIRASPLGSRRLSKLYPVSRSAIAAIKRGSTWRHVK